MSFSPISPRTTIIPSAVTVTPPHLNNPVSAASALPKPTSLQTQCVITSESVNTLINSLIESLRQDDAKYKSLYAELNELQDKITEISNRTVSHKKTKFAKTLNTNSEKRVLKGKIAEKTSKCNELGTKIINLKPQLIALMDILEGDYNQLFLLQKDEEATDSIRLKKTSKRPKTPEIKDLASSKKGLTVTASNIKGLISANLKRYEQSAAVYKTHEDELTKLILLSSNLEKELTEKTQQISKVIKLADQLTNAEKSVAAYGLKLDYEAKIRQIEKDKKKIEAELKTLEIGRMAMNAWLCQAKPIFDRLQKHVSTETEALTHLILNSSDTQPFTLSKHREIKQFRKSNSLSSLDQPC